MDNKELIATARKKATTDSPIHELLKELADALEELVSEREGLLEASRLVKATWDKANRIEEHRDELIRECDALATTLERVRGWADPKCAPGYSAENRLAEIADALDSAPHVTLPSQGEWDDAITAERARQIAKGYDAEHDAKHGVDHLLAWSVEYARVGKVLKSSALVAAARALLASSPVARPLPDRETLLNAIPLKHWGAQSIDDRVSLVDAVLAAIETAPVVSDDTKRQPEWRCESCNYPWPAGQGNPNMGKWDKCPICGNDEWVAIEKGGESVPAWGYHLSDCAVHNEPAMPAGPCNCEGREATHAFDRMFPEVRESLNRLTIRKEGATDAEA